MATCNATCQKNTPVIRSASDHPQLSSNPTDRGAPDADNASSTNDRDDSGSLGQLTLSGSNIPASIFYENTASNEAQDALIKRIHDAVDAGVINEPFTSQHIDSWMIEYEVRQPNGRKYSRNYASTLLSTSYKKKKMQKNGNSVWLDRRLNEDSVYEYWFD
jgi:hypothetical protein